MNEKRTSTRLIHNHAGGRLAPTVNPPLERGSTLLLSNQTEMYAATPSYGRMGLSVHRELESVLSDLEGGVKTQLTPNGLSACTLAIAANVVSGDHVLIADNVYGPTRRFCTRRLAAMGVEASFFDPRMGGDIKDKFRASTTAIFVESPGSLTFELSDLPAIAEVAKANNITVIADNTWGAGVFYHPLKLGADVSVHALTKYAVGHADYFGGAIISAAHSHATQIETCATEWGFSLGPEEAYAALRGMRTLHTRLAAHQSAALDIAHWLEQQDEVSAVLHPAMESHPDHTLWKRDFTGSCGLFSIVLKEMKDAVLEKFLSGIELFGFGFSWGGYESLINPADRHVTRDFGPWNNSALNGRLLRIHVGLEDIADLKADLAAAFDRIRTHPST